MTDELLVRYVESALLKQQAGETVDIDELCHAHPEIVDLVRKTLELQGVLSAAEHGDPLLGENLDDRYLLEGVLGAGAMGVVYEAMDKTLGRRVAVKVLNPGVIASPAREKRFKREARALASLDHPHIVRIFDHGRSKSGWHYIVMERLQGASLGAVLDEVDHLEETGDGAVDPTLLTENLGLRSSDKDYLPMVVAWIADLASALRVSHANGVFHRDIKPSNAIITEDGRPVLLDFGIAVREGDEPLTLGGSTVGTPWYMAPEQAAGGGAAATAASDVYGLCATLYHLTTLRPPYIGDFVEVLVQLKSEDPPPPGSLRSDLPRDLCAIVEKGLARDLGHRYSDMEELETDLRSFLAYRPVTARPLNGAIRTWRRLRHRPAPMIAGLIAMALIISAIVLTVVWQDAQIAEQEEFDRQFATQPALICFQSFPSDRPLRELTERRHALELMESLRELRPDDTSVCLIRASLFLDQGEHAKSLAEVERLTAGTGSLYLKAVAAAYRDANTDVTGANALDFSALPEPRTPQDWFINGFHLLRGRKGMAKAHEHLCRAEDYVPARDLRLLTGFMVARGIENQTRRQRELRKVQTAALELQGHYGFNTARICHVIGAVHLELREWDAAVPFCELALSIRPNQHGTMDNLAIAHRRLGRLDESMDLLRECRTLRPWNWKTLHTMAQVLADKGKYAEAMVKAAEIPKEGEGGEGQWRAFLMGIIATRRGWSALDANKPQDARRFADESLGHFRDALRLGVSEREIAGDIAFAEYLRDGELEKGVLHFLKAMSDDPLNAAHIKELAWMLRSTGLSPAATKRLSDYLGHLSEGLTPTRDPEAPQASKQLTPRKP